jgi:hypothetical protein
VPYVHISTSTDEAVEQIRQTKSQLRLKSCKISSNNRSTISTNKLNRKKEHRLTLIHNLAEKLCHRRFKEKFRQNQSHRPRLPQLQLQLRCRVVLLLWLVPCKVLWLCFSLPRWCWHRVKTTNKRFESKVINAKHGS